MIVWWESLSTIGKIFAAAAIPSTVILLLQTILMLIGIGGHALSDAMADADADADVGGDVGDIGDGGDVDVHDGIFGDGDSDVDADADADFSLRLFSFRGIIAFVCVFGWVGVLCTRYQLATPLAVLLSVVAGFVAMLVIAVLFRMVYSLQSDGTEDIRNALGASGTVYLRIPAQREGCGKVNLLLDGKLVEKEAITDDREIIQYGEQIVVIGISGGAQLLVRRKLQK